MKKYSSSQRRTTPAVEIAGQCKRCLDFFSVSVVLAQGTTPVLATTPRLQWSYDKEHKNPVLIHRPGVCNGKVNLYGSLEALSPGNTTLRYVFPSTAATTTDWSALETGRF
jgi:hypothetical protein